MENEIQTKPSLLARAKKAPLLAAMILLAVGISFAAIAAYAGNAYSASGNVSSNPSTVWNNFDVGTGNQVSTPSANISSLNFSAGDTITSNLTMTNTANNAFNGTANITFNDLAQDYVGGEVANVFSDDGSGPVAMTCGAATTAGISCTSPIFIAANSTLHLGMTGDISFAYAASDIQMNGKNN